MDSFVAAKDAARKKLSVAEHILTQTYPLVKDPKLLIAVLQNVNDAVESGIDAMVAYEHRMKRIPPPGNDFDSRFVSFSRHVVPGYGIPAEFLRFVGELRETMREHRKSPIEFVRKERFVICNESYKVRTLSPDQLKRHVGKAKAFINMVEEKVARNDAIITRRG